MIPGDIIGQTYGVKLDDAKRSCNGLQLTSKHSTMHTEQENLFGYTTEKGWLVWYMDKGAKAMVRITFSIGEQPEIRRIYHLYVWDGEYTKVGKDRMGITTFVDDTAKLYRDYGDLSNLVLVWEDTTTFEIKRTPEVS